MSCANTPTKASFLGRSDIGAPLVVSGVNNMLNIPSVLVGVSENTVDDTRLILEGASHQGLQHVKPGALYQALNSLGSLHEYHLEPCLGGK